MRDHVVPHVRRGHPWVYREAVAAGLPSAPGLVRVTGKGLDAVGIVDPDSPIAVRIWSLRQSGLDRGSVHDRVAAAAALRRSRVPADTTGFRLLHGEGDRTPGVVADVFDGTAILQTDTPGVRPLLRWIADAIADLVPAVERVALQTGSPGERELEPLVGTQPRPPLWFQEAGLTFAANPIAGHKTGFYLDQRPNRTLVRELAPGLEVLNLFGYTGGFSVAAAVGGAARVTTVDQAAPALAAARENFTANGLDPSDAAYRFVAADVFERLREPAADLEADLVICDPPSMARSEAARSRALKAYRRLNAAALATVRRPGWLLTFSCSSHIHEEDLVQAVADGSADSGVPCRVARYLGPGADHPVQPAFPEGRYLNGLLLFVA